MSVDRIRKVDDKREMEEVVDDYITTGYEVMDRGQGSIKLRKNDGWGSIGGHIAVFLLTAWFSAGIGNLIYALVKRYNGEKVLVQLRRD